MSKKIVTLLVALFLMFTTSFVFAAENAGNGMQDSLNKAGNTIGNVVNGAGNVVRNGVGAIENGIENLGNTFSAGASRVTNNNNNNHNNNSNNTNNNTGNNNNGANNNYTTARTATGTGTFAGMSANTWTWFILAIAGLAIVGMVWYYSMQNNSERINDNTNE